VRYEIIINMNSAVFALIAGSPLSNPNNNVPTRAN
jgi:hypothetical protein